MKELLKKHTFTFVMFLTLIFSLTACSSNQQEESSVENTIPMESSTEAIVEEPETTTLMETTVESETESLTEETTLELSEPIAYEGIDMESDLPGVEWLDTFYGIIDEPKLVILNDSINKKNC